MLWIRIYLGNILLVVQIKFNSLPFFSLFSPEQLCYPPRCAHIKRLPANPNKWRWAVHMAPEYPWSWSSMEMVSQYLTFFAFKNYPPSGHGRSSANTEYNYSTHVMSHSLLQQRDATTQMRWWMAANDVRKTITIIQHFLRNHEYCPQQRNWHNLWLVLCHCCFRWCGHEFVFEAARGWHFKTAKWHGNWSEATGELFVAKCHAGMSKPPTHDSQISILPPLLILLPRPHSQMPLGYDEAIQKSFTACPLNRRSTRPPPLNSG